jgi:hypothetical protein
LHWPVTNHARANDTTITRKKRVSVAKFGSWKMVLWWVLRRRKWPRIQWPGFNDTEFIFRGFSYHIPMIFHIRYGIYYSDNEMICGGSGEDDHWLGYVSVAVVGWMRLLYCTFTLPLKARGWFIKVNVRRLALLLYTDKYLRLSSATHTSAGRVMMCITERSMIWL